MSHGRALALTLGGQNALCIAFADTPYEMRTVQVVRDHNLGSPLVYGAGPAAVATWAPPGRCDPGQAESFGGQSTSTVQRR